MLDRIMGRTIAVAFFCIATISAAWAADYPPPTEGDYTIRDFKFGSGETLPELKIHYRTLGKIDKDAHGKVTNAVLIMHGTTGSGAQFIRPEFAGELLGKDQLLDMYAVAWSEAATQQLIAEVQSRYEKRLKDSRKEHVQTEDEFTGHKLDLGCGRG